MELFDIFITYVRWDNGGKRRPALVFKRDGDRIIIFPITTQYENKSEAVRSKYFRINDWAQAGLDKQSYVDTGSPRRAKETAFANDTIIGKLTDADKRRLLAFFGV
jgi:hypothetical protein